MVDGDTLFACPLCDSDSDLGLYLKRGRTLTLKRLVTSPERVTGWHGGTRVALLRLGAAT